MITGQRPRIKDMKNQLATLFAMAVALTGAGYALAQDDEKPAMSFFLTSVGSGDGANLGGIDGADAHCSNLAEAAGHEGKTWRAYLSTDPRPGQPAIHARDRIGEGPWYNYDGREIAANLSHLHGDTLEEARNGNRISWFTALTEAGDNVNMVGDKPNKHDILTGTKLDGESFNDDMDHTCNNWTSNDEGTAQLGHHDRTSSGSISWVSAHPSRGCSQDDLRASGGDGLFYCFAID
jgi:hypothetical protein